MAINREAVAASAEKLVARGKIDGAIKEYRKLVAANPTDAMTLNRLGDLYVRQKKNDEAVKLFTQIAERYTEDGFFVKAIAIFKKIIKLDPTRLPVYERLAELYHKQGLVSEARTQYQVLVDYYLKHGKVESAESVLAKMTALDSGDPTPHVRLAEIYRDRGEHEKEMAEYRALAEMMIRHKRVDEAAQVYARAIAGAPDDLGFITDAVLGLKDAGATAAAARLLALAVEKNPQAEKIARIAGLARDSRTDSSSTGVRRPVDDEPRVFKVSDVTSAPPELREPPPRASSAASGSTVRPELHPDDLLSAEQTADELERRFSGAGRTAEMEAVDGLSAGAFDEAAAQSMEGAEIGFDLEIEGVDLTAPPPSASEPAPEPQPPEEPIEWSFEPEPDLELDLELPQGTAISPQAAADELFAEVEPTGVVEPAAQAPVAAPPSADRRLGDLLAEAEVFRKFGLGGKAGDRVREILREDSGHAGALALAIHLSLDGGRPDRALARAQELARLAAKRPDAADVWGPVRSRLTKAGFEFDERGPLSAPAPKPKRKDRVAALLDELSGLSRATRPKRAKPAVRPADDLAALVDGLREEIAPKARPAAAAPGPMAAPEPVPEVSTPVASEVAGIEVTAPPPELPLAAEATEAAIEDRLFWLDHAAARAAASAPAAPVPGTGSAELFEDEEGFFDLAAELEEELTQEEIVTGHELLPREEPSLEEIVEGFKRGVAESLSPEDFDTHFNLGIAYREMGLLDEAIGEFQLAAKHGDYLLDCCSLLGGCFLEKGLPELAVKWYKRGLSTPNLSEDANLGLLYDLGNLYLLTSDAESAKRTFIELYGINSNYRDIVPLLEQLGSS